MRLISHLYVFISHLYVFMIKIAKTNKYDIQNASLVLQADGQYSKHITCNSIFTLGDSHANKFVLGNEINSLFPTSPEYAKYFTILLFTITLYLFFLFLFSSEPHIRNALRTRIPLSQIKASSENRKYLKFTHKYL